MREDTVVVSSRLALVLLPLVVAVAAAAPVAPSTPQGLAQAINGFALCLYGELGRKPGNLFFSPYSVSTALAMTGIGARGDTRQQMESTLLLRLEGDQTHAACGALIEQLNRAGAGGAYELATANRLFGQRSYPFREEFVLAVKKAYGAGLARINFARDPERARRLINRWVEKRTREKIKDLIPARGVDGDTRLVLTNAIYFKGDWETAFAKEATRPAPFYRASGEPVQAPLMVREDRYGYAEKPGFQVLELAYKGGDLSMAVLLPKERQGLARLEAEIRKQGMAWALSGLSVQKVRVFLPKFRVSYAEELKKSLSALGMSLAFGRKADFSGMTGKLDLYISKVFHQAFVDVNEEGTEAAAATAVVMTQKGMSFDPPVPVFRADHPFLFLIRHRASGAALFMGRIASPIQP